MLFKLYKLLLTSAMVLTFSNGKAENKDQHIKVVLRSIGHEFLLQLNDSTSRVLPIRKVEGRYRIQFEREFDFEPALLSFSTYKSMEQYEITDTYIVEVEKCGTKEVVHSFKTGLVNDTAVACRERPLPKACYDFYFTLVEDKLTVMVNENNNQFNFSYLYAVLVLLLGGGVLVYFNKRNKSVKLNSDLIPIGQYQFDQKRMTLTLNSQSIELSSKESDLLYLLYANSNKTLEREYMLNIVWGDEGDYVGRTLDVFISKLRKKLEHDSSIKIINVRGVGYRFVVN